MLGVWGKGGVIDSVCIAYQYDRMAGEVEFAADGEPDAADGRLTTSQGEELAKLLNEKAPKVRCEVCGGGEFVLNPFLASPRFIAIEPDGLTAIDYSASHPCIVAHCSDCGNTKFHSLHFLGYDLEEGKADG